jgi:hypothetical protein
MLLLLPKEWSSLRLLYLCMSMFVLKPRYRYKAFHKIPVIPIDLAVISCTSSI